MCVVLCCGFGGVGNIVQKQRSHQKHDFFRRTKSGQPVMKVRVDKILEVLQQEKGLKH